MTIEHHEGSIRKDYITQNTFNAIHYTVFFSWFGFPPDNEYTVAIFKIKYK